MNTYLYHYGVPGMKWGVWNDETRARRMGFRSQLNYGMALRPAVIKQWKKDEGKLSVKKAQKLDSKIDKHSRKFLKQISKEIIKNPHSSSDFNKAMKVGEAIRTNDLYNKYDKRTLFFDKDNIFSYLRVNNGKKKVAQLETANKEALKIITEAKKSLIKDIEREAKDVIRIYNMYGYDLINSPYYPY